MGFGGRKVFLPAPTDSLVGSVAEETGVSEDLATDLSQRTDKTSLTIPDDGSPITISTKKKSSRTDKSPKGKNISQTSLLIEYFEGGKGSDSTRRPSVRVKVTPSSRKTKDKSDGHIVLTEAHGTRKPSYSRRISLGPKQSHRIANESDISALDPFPGAPAPVDIEIEQKGSDISDLSASPEARYIPATSDISSMPADSMLGAQHSTIAIPRKPIESSNISSMPTERSELSQTDMMESTSLRPPVIPAERNLSNERITQKVIEKLSNKPRDPARSLQRSTERSSAGSSSRDMIAATMSERPRVSSKHFKEDESVTSFTEPSLLSNSVLSAGGRSIDQRSAKSGVSNVSINNPKLLQTVEDAIRRLILPELKELKKEQRHGSHRSKHDKDYSDLSENSISREKSGHRVSSGSKSRRRVSGDGVEGSSSRRRRSHQRDHDYDSVSDVSSRRRESTSSISVDDPQRSKHHHKDHKVRDMAAAGLIGAGLTAAALKQRESEESISRQRRRRRSKSRSSRSGSVAESDDTFKKHSVPPMPMQSEVGSELTRSSLLSSNTTGTATPTQYEVREVVRGSPGETFSPESHTPTRQTRDLRQTLGTHHGNFSEHNLSSNKLSQEEQDEDVDDPASSETERYNPMVADVPLEDPVRMEQYERNLHTQHPIRRGLSPIQSVASYTTEQNRNSMHHPRSVESFASSVRKGEEPLREVASVSSSGSSIADLKKHRPHGISLENRSEIMRQHDDLPRNERAAQYHDIQEGYSDGEQRYRDSFASGKDTLDSRHLSGFTDDTSSVQYVDKVTAGQYVVPGYGANPEYIHTPPGVESAVASLIEPSNLDIRDSQISYDSGSIIPEEASIHSAPHYHAGMATSKQQNQQTMSRSQTSLENSRAVNLSPAQSPARSFTEEISQHKVSNPHSPLPVPQQEGGLSPESEITTNPSPIQGPIAAGTSNPWPYNPNPISNNQQVLSREFSSGAVDLIPEGLNVSQRPVNEPKSNTYVIGRAMPTPPGIHKDEGYVTGDNYPSPGPVIQEEPELYVPEDTNIANPFDDPFTSKRNQYMSGLSQGMSPLYDSATGKGIDRIQSKDIVALMDHLTVRDAQRSARDTEILFALVQSATEMRNSFDEMKNYLAEQDKLLIQTTEKQNVLTQKAINGPRPPPNASTRYQRGMSSEDDLPSKRRNVFKRALQGLGSKNSAELQNIEAMLFQLLDEVEALRAQQSLSLPQTQTNSTPTAQPRSTSVASEEHTRLPTDPGYEPEGQAGTSTTTGDRSGFFSNNSSRQGYYNAARRMSGNRVSTVMEGDEELDEYDNTLPDVNGQRTPRASSPTLEMPTQNRSAAFNTPPRMPQQVNGAFSDENTPHLSIDESSSKKHKSFASSFLPKMVSRWSRTTTSSGGDAYRSSVQQKARPYSQVSNSGENLHEFQYEQTADDRLRSNTSLQNEQYHDQENRPPSPLMPSQVSDNPKYQGFRNSVNLQHPQPRQGPTGRYQSTLETAAQDYDQMSPTSQNSSQWENHPAMTVMDPNFHNQGAHYVQQPPLSPISDAGYSETSSAMLERDGYVRQMKTTGSQNSMNRRGPPRPPKVPDDDPLVPHRPAKIPMSPSTYVDHVAVARAGSPAYDKSPIGALRSPASSGRKPSGPRPLSGQGKRTRFTNSPLQHDSEDDGGY